MAKKPRPLPQGAHKASIRASVLIAELIKVRTKQAILKQRAAMLRTRLEAEGLGTAHGYRSYIAYTSASRRTISVKATRSVKLVAYSGEVK